MTLEGLREKYGNETVLCVACDKLESSTMDIKNIIAADILISDIVQN